MTLFFILIHDLAVNFAKTWVNCNGAVENIPEH